MRHFFTNETPGNREQDGVVVNATGNYGIIPHGINIQAIQDGNVTDVADLNKIGSSMPSPVARLFLFQAAIEEINSLEGQNAYRGIAHNYITDSEGKPELTPYHYLVSEMLDMLEFIYKYGDYPEFHVFEWKIQEEAEILKNSGIKEHKQLASALESAFSFGALEGQPVYLFKWNKIVVGGSSPVSLVYTSANRRHENLPKFTGNAGNTLFGETPTPLHKRDSKFRSYIYCLYHAMSGIKSFDALSKYIMDSGVNYDDNIWNAATAAPGNYDGAKELTSQGRPVIVCGVQLYATDNTIVINPTTSDYIIEPSKGCTIYKKSITKTPLVLTQQGEKGLVYAAGREWDTKSDRIVNPSSNINERTLPGLGKTQYPYLTTEDFLEDKIVEVSYNINCDKYITGCSKSTTYLLPLKKLFFQFFTIEDLKKKNMLSLTYDNDREKVVVRLTIPLVNDNSITLYKDYTENDKVDCYDGAMSLDFAVFPFYRLQPDLASNVYNVMLGYTLPDVKLSFYEQDEDTLNEVDTETSVRTLPAEGKLGLSSKHIRVKGAFSFIELYVTKDDHKYNAIAIPELMAVNATNGKSFHFSIDFGTTNTYVSYAVTNRATDAYGKSDVKPFVYDERDPQVVTFHSNDGAGEFTFFPTAVKRELIPSVIKDNVKFPLRTCTYQTGDPHVLEMFFNTNIGFNYSEDISQAANYCTNIKWDKFDSKSMDRMSTYFAQMLWMMKNKCLLNGGSENFSVVVTYPISMHPGDLESFKNSWEAAKQLVRCEQVKIVYRTESVAPYYSYLVGMNYGESYANIDIGGGTTDILYVNPISKEANVYSAFFAANDLWNDGLDRVAAKDKANGFLKYYMALCCNNLGDKKNELDKVVNTSSSSADVINYLFTNDSWSRFSSEIKASREMMQLPIIHFSALCFYTAYILHMGEVEIPKNMSFTGMGSKYISLINQSEAGIARIINAIFKKAGEIFDNPDLKNANVSVKFPPNPKEITAEGALISKNYPNSINPSEDIYFGFDNEIPGKTFRIRDLNAGVQSNVLSFFEKFIDLLSDESVTDVFVDQGYNISSDIISALRKNATPSFTQMEDRIKAGQIAAAKVTEPMFFWPLKNSLYVIGKQLAQKAINAKQVNNGADGDF